MYRLITDIGVELNLNENELVAAAESELDFIINDKKYDIKEVSVELVCQDIVGRLEKLSEEVFPEDARKIVEKVIQKKRAELIEH